MAHVAAGEQGLAIPADAEGAEEVAVLQTPAKPCVRFVDFPKDGAVRQLAGQRGLVPGDDGRAVQFASVAQVGDVDAFLIGFRRDHRVDGAPCRHADQGILDRLRIHHVHDHLVDVVEEPIEPLDDLRHRVPLAAQRLLEVVGLEGAVHRHQNRPGGEDQNHQEHRRDPEEYAAAHACGQAFVRAPQGDHGASPLSERRDR